MHYRLFVILVVLALAVPDCLGQAKEGTTGFNFLMLSPSLRSNGMGHVAVALVDEQSYFSNPGTLGLLVSDGWISSIPYAGSTDLLGYDLLHWGASAPLWRSKVGENFDIGAGAAFARTRLASPQYEEIDYLRAPTARTFQWKDRSLDAVAAVSLSGPVQVGLGATYRHIKETAEDLEASGWAADVGLLVRHPLQDVIFGDPRGRFEPQLTPSLGVAWANLGPKIECGGNEYDLPRTLRVGAAIEAGINYPSAAGDWQVAALTISAENEKQRDRESFERFGLELGAAEAVWLRYGNGNDLETWGFTISSGGLIRAGLTLFTGNADDLRTVPKLLTTRIIATYSEAHHNYRIYRDDVTFRGFSVRYRLFPPSP